MRDDAPSMAVFCDFENVALGVKDAKYDPFDIELVIERLLDKGKIVVKKAYADWERYRSAKRGLHEAAFELIEIPHASYSGKNSADIRVVVDALDLCYTKDHVDIFVIVSGDSDFSPLVSKLRENDKTVIGMGVKNSSSELLIDNCDEFIFYDDLVREKRSSRTQKSTKKRPKPPQSEPEKKAQPKRGTQKNGDDKRKSSEKVDPKVALKLPPKVDLKLDPKVDLKIDPGADPNADPNDDSKAEPEPKAETEQRPDEMSGDKEEALEMVLDTVEALFRERDENLWGSMIKQTLKRKKPHFSEAYFGYRTFNQLLEDAERRGLLELEKDSKSGGYIILAFGPNA
jgi:uncharacterized protein (TIGR00288 family)